MRKYTLAALLFILQFTLSNAQMVGPNAYLKGANVEVGIDGNGGFEGCDMTVSPPLPGMHPRAGAGINLFGFVADPALDGWTNFDGDFFTPGSPENGWGFEIGTSGISQGNNCNSLAQIPGTLTYTNNFSCHIVDWEGDAGSGTDLHFKVSYVLQNSDLYYTTTVSVKNNTTTAIPELYYYRNLDPDNDESLSGSYTTTQTIVNEPNTGSCNLAHVKATQSSPWNSYIGLAAIGSNWRAIYGGFSNRDGSDLWNGVGSTGTPFVQTIGATNTDDEAIALAYKVENLDPGETATFKFVVILDDAAASNAIANLLYFAYPGSVLAPPTACTPYTDTARTCGGPVPIGVQGEIVNDYNWSWSPTTGLSSPTGSYITANPPTTTTYTITGTPISPCFSPVSLTIVVQVTPATGANPYITPVAPICTGSSPFGLTVDSAGGIWTGPGIANDTLGIFDPSSAGVGTHIITYTTPGLCNTTDTIAITVISSASAIIDPTTPVCAGAAPFNLTSAGPGGVWSGTGITDSIAGTFSPVASGPGSFIVSYTIPGSCTAVDTVLVRVLPIMNDPSITPVPSQCTGYPSFNLMVDSTGGTWSGVGITSPSLGIFDPATAGVGTHTIVYSINGFCPTSDSTLITVNFSYNATITPPPTICYGSAPYNLNAVDTSGIWSGTGITDPIAGVFDPAISGPGNFTIIYNIAAACPSSDTVTITVGAVTTPVTGFTYDSVPVCVSSGLNPVPTTVAGFTPGGVYSSGSAGLGLDSSTGVIDLASSTSGTYIVTYTVAATICGPAGSSTATITIDPVIMPLTNFSYAAPVCLSDSAVVPIIPAGFTTGGIFSAGGLRIDSTGVFYPSTGTSGTYNIIYNVVGSNSLCTGSGSTVVTVVVNPKPTITISSEQSIFIGGIATLNASGGIAYEWTPTQNLSCTTCNSTVASPSETTNYCVRVTDNNTCYDSSCVKVNVEIPCPTNRNLVVPNAFTPNGDGYNDELCLYGWDNCVTEFMIMIYDRWGEKVFESKDPNFCWDGIYKGKLLDPAVFVYFINAVYETSGANPLAPMGKVDVNKKGNISLVR